MDDAKILVDSEIKSRLKNLRGWKYGNNKIQKSFAFPDFNDGLNFVNNLAAFFEAHNHHPDIHLYYRNVVFELQRFDVGGKVTASDFLTAHKIEEAYSQRNPDVPG